MPVPTKFDNSSKISKSYEHPQRPKSKGAVLAELRAQEEVSPEESLSPVETDCVLCCETLGAVAFTCPNTACYHRICINCRDRTLANDHRCSFCRTQLLEATLTRPTWGAHLDDDYDYEDDDGDDYDDEDSMTELTSEFDGSEYEPEYESTDEEDMISDVDPEHPDYASDCSDSCEVCHMSYAESLERGIEECMERIEGDEVLRAALDQQLACENEIW